MLEGHYFDSRMELSRVVIHPPPLDGLAGNPHIGCFSIVLNSNPNGAYVNHDDGDVVDCSGEKPKEGSDLDDQLSVGGNLALEVSHDNGLPVRVTRGYRIPIGPPIGYRFDDI